MDLLDRLRVLLTGGTRRPGPKESDDEDTIAVTIERSHPDAVSQPAATDNDSAQPASQPVDSESGSLSEGAQALTDLTGIGPAYAKRLAGAGIQSIDELGAADPQATAEATGLSEQRVRRWIDRARDRN